MAKDRTLYIDHLLEAVAHIEADIQRVDYDDFRADRRTRQLVERNLEIVSESSRRIPEALKAKEKDVDWRSIAGIGNVLRHDYHQIHPIILRETCKKDIPLLKQAVMRIRCLLEEE